MLFLDSDSLHSSYISGLRIDEAFGKYRMSCKVGTYCVFGFEQISNQRHHHDCYELCIIIDGKGSFYHGDRLYKLQKGDIIIAEPDVQHEIQANSMDNLTLLYIFIEINKSNRAAAAKSHGDRCIEGFLAAHGNIASRINLLAYLAFIEEYNSPKKKSHFGTYEALKNLILESLSALSDKSSGISEDIIKNIIENALDFIDANLHKRILVKDVAANCCTSARNLEYLFHKHLGRTVVGYINEKKMELACHYLKMYFSITDTSNMVGIANPSQFSALFKKYKGISPKQYQTESAPDRKGMGRRI